MNYKLKKLIMGGAIIVIIIGYRSTNIYSCNMISFYNILDDLLIQLLNCRVQFDGENINQLIIMHDRQY